ncbi:MAG: iron-containing alcohol dehydrogenase [Coprobacillus sp.]|nr:iron-containing alcohol dehydrogenase [Coprobacillus sp.]
MNIFKKAYCRIYQGVFRLLLPVLPYKNPKLLNDSREIAAVLKDKNLMKPLIVSDKNVLSLGLGDDLFDELNKQGIEYAVYDKTQPNPTTDNVEEALKLYKDAGCDSLIGLGGGSPIDCVKAVGARVANPKKTCNKMAGILKVRKKIPLLFAIPTTAGTGSETTLAAVITDSQNHHKYAINAFKLIPSYAVLDYKMTLGLPKGLTATTGMDALTHAIEAYIGRSTTKETRKYALEAIDLIFKYLPVAYEDGQNIEAREQMQLAAYYAGIAFTKSYVGYVHAVAHSLGGQYNIAHGLANAIILPYVLKDYDKHVYKKLDNIAVYLGLCNKKDPKKKGFDIILNKIEEMNAEFEVPTKIAEILPEDIEKLAKHADKEANPLYPVPVLYDYKHLEKIYYDLLAGNLND